MNIKFLAAVTTPPYIYQSSTRKIPRTRLTLMVWFKARFTVMGEFTFSSNIKGKNMPIERKLLGFPETCKTR